MWIRVIAACALGSMACGKSGSGDHRAGSGGSGNATGSGSAAGSHAAEATYTLHEDYEPKIQVTVHVALPSGWHDNQLGGPESVNFQGSWMAHLSIGITCDGSCDTPEVATKNIAKSADEAFAFVSSKDHIPPL